MKKQKASHQPVAIIGLKGVWWLDELNMSWHNRHSQCRLVVRVTWKAYFISWRYCLIWQRLAKPVGMSELILSGLPDR
jgi:hypothetical protein